MVEVLEPCPFCGEQSAIVIAGDRVWIECADCPHKVEVGPFNTEAEAITAWNTRHRTATLQQVIDLANACVDQGIPLTAMALDLAAEREMVRGLEAALRHYVDTCPDSDCYDGCANCLPARKALGEG